MMEWISVKDRLPGESGRYLTVYWGCVGILQYSAKHGLFNVYDWYKDCNVDRQSIAVTHWMPLPKLPEESEVESDG